MVAWGARVLEGVSFEHFVVASVQRRVLLLLSWRLAVIILTGMITTSTMLSVLAPLFVVVLIMVELLAHLRFAGLLEELRQDPPRVGSVDVVELQKVLRLDALAPGRAGVLGGGRRRVHLLRDVVDLDGARGGEGGRVPEGSCNRPSPALRIEQETWG